MPIYNGIEYLDESIYSIKSQTMDAWELIIGVNGHPPNSIVFQMAKRHESSKIRVLDLTECHGKSEALNAMVPHCQYDWIALLDVDDIWSPDKLQIQKGFTDSYDVIGSHARFFGNRGGQPWIPLNDITHYNFKTLNPIVNSSVLLRKPLAHWDNANTHGHEDYQLWLELRYHSLTPIRFYNCPDILVGHRIHSTSAFNSRGNSQSARELVRKVGK